MNRIPWNIVENVRAGRRAAGLCEQCGKPLEFEKFLGPVCGKCCRANHKHCTK